MAKKDEATTTGIAPDPSDENSDAAAIDAGRAEPATGKDAEVFAVINPRFHLVDSVELRDEEADGGDGATYEFTHEPRGLSAAVFERLTAQKWADGDVRRQIIVRDPRGGQ